MATRLSDCQRWMLRDIQSERMPSWPIWPGEVRTVKSLIRLGFVVEQEQDVYQLAITEEGKEWLRRRDSRIQGRGA